MDWLSGLTPVGILRSEHASGDWHKSSNMNVTVLFGTLSARLINRVSCVWVAVGVPLFEVELTSSLVIWLYPYYERALEVLTRTRRAGGTFISALVEHLLTGFTNLWFHVTRTVFISRDVPLPTWLKPFLARCKSRKSVGIYLPCTAFFVSLTSTKHSWWHCLLSHSGTVSLHFPGVSFSRKPSWD